MVSDSRDRSSLQNMVPVLPTLPACIDLMFCYRDVYQSRIIGSGIRIKLGIWRELSEDRHLASSLVAEDPEESGELTLSAHTDTDTDTGIWRVWVEIIYFQLNFF